MPTEPELAASLGVSRATVRDAIKVLSGKGLVRTARRYGTRVLPVEDWNLLDGDVVGWHRRDHPRMRRIFAETTELRSIMEPAAAALAAERATEAQIRTILDAAYAIHPEADDVQALFDADCRFHVTILDATQNQVMRQLRQIIVTMLRVSYDFGVSRQQNDPVTRQGHILSPRRSHAAMAKPLARAWRRCSRGTEVSPESNAVRDEVVQIRTSEQENRPQARYQSAAFDGA